jgi:hypothetical protein
MTFVHGQKKASKRNQAALDIARIGLYLNSSKYTPADFLHKFGTVKQQYFTMLHTAGQVVKYRNLAILSY